MIGMFRTARLLALAGLWCSSLLTFGQQPPPTVFGEASLTHSDPTHVLLEWTTEGEDALNYIEVERSDDGLTFYPVRQVTAHGTSTELQEYNYFDYTDINRTHYYRLRAVRFDGEALRSRIYILPGLQVDALPVAVYAQVSSHDKINSFLHPQ